MTAWPSLEVVVVDDASTDDSAAIVEQLVAESPDRVRLVRLTTNGGPARARNAGARVAVGEVLFFLDSDTEMMPNALTQAAARLASQEVDAVVGVYAARPLNPGAAPLYKALISHYFFIRKGVVPYEVFDSARAGIRAHVFHSLGGFNEALRWGMDYENEDLGYRIDGRFHMVLDPSVEVRHVFPGLPKLCRVYFTRTALWMELFAARRRFESGGVTTMDTGLATAALPVAALLAPLALLKSPWCWLALVVPVLLAVYLRGYAGFFAYVARERRGFLLTGIALNMLFTLVITTGALFGVLRVLTGTSCVTPPLPARVGETPL